MVENDNNNSISIAGGDNSSGGSIIDVDSVLRVGEEGDLEEFQLVMDSDNDLDSIDFNISEEDKQSSEGNLGRLSCSSETVKTA